MATRKPQPDKRTRLIETAMKLAYRNGFRETSLADIAEAAHVPVGNVYYYFKTKEELGEAVVEQRLAEFRELREEMDRLSSPKERLFAFVESIHGNREVLARGGCPLGRLVFRVAQGGRRSRERNPRHSSPSQWAGSRSNSGRPAMKRMHENFPSISSVLFRVWLRSAHAANDPDLVVMEVKRLKDWIGTL